MIMTTKDATNARQCNNSRTVPTRIAKRSRSGEHLRLESNYFPPADMSRMMSCPGCRVLESGGNGMARSQAVMAETS